MTRQTVEAVKDRSHPSARLRRIALIAVAVVILSFSWWFSPTGSQMRLADDHGLEAITDPADRALAVCIVDHLDADANWGRPFEVLDVRGGSALLDLGSQLATLRDGESFTEVVVDSRRIYTAPFSCW